MKQLILVILLWVSICVNIYLIMFIYDHYYDAMANICPTISVMPVPDFKLVPTPKQQWL